MKDNNPFHPENNSAGTRRSRVMLDGISQDYNSNDDNKSESSIGESNQEVNPIDPDLLARALSEENSSDKEIPNRDQMSPEMTDANDFVANNSEDNEILNFDNLTQSENNHTEPESLVDSTNKNKPAKHKSKKNSAKKSAATLSAIDALAEQSDTAPINDQIGGEKPAKQFTISLLTIILFIIAIAGIGGTIYFALQNNKNSNELANAKAKVQELTEKQEQNAVNSETNSAQFDALQEKITKLTDENNDKEKTLDENKKTIDEQKKKIDELDKNNTDLTKKVQHINDLTTRTDKLLKKLDSIYQETPEQNNSL